MLEDFPIRLAGMDALPEREACADIMCGTTPWTTYGMPRERMLNVLGDPTGDLYIAGDQGGVAGFMSLCMTGPFVGYLRVLAVRDDMRGKGLGTRLIRHAESLVFPRTPNMFIMVASFNPKARALYERLGYAVVGTFVNYAIKGHDELLLRKTSGSLMDFCPEQT